MYLFGYDNVLDYDYVLDEIDEHYWMTIAIKCLRTTGLGPRIACDRENVTLEKIYKFLISPNCHDRHKAVTTLMALSWSKKALHPCNKSENDVVSLQLHLSFFDQLKPIPLQLM